MPFPRTRALCPASGYNLSAHLGPKEPSISSVENKTWRCLLGYASYQMSWHQVSQTYFFHKISNQVGSKILSSKSDGNIVKYQVNARCFNQALSESSQPLLEIGIPILLQLNYEAG